MKKIVLMLALLAAHESAFAHVSYTGRNFGTFTGLTSETSTINNQRVTSNFGWADAADGDLGDSHHGRAFRFTLQNQAWVDISIAENAISSSVIAGLIPSFSVYSGLAAISPFPAGQTSADHDFNPASEAWRTTWAEANLGAGKTVADTDGSWNAVGDWKMGGDGDVAEVDSQLSSFIYVASATSMTHSVTGRFLLNAGDYTLFVGGNGMIDHMDVANYGIAATLSVSAVPEPESMAMLLSGLGLLVFCASRKHKV